jgi:hypothetical protein
MKLKHLIEKQNTHYKCAIPIGIQIARSFYKLAHGTKYFQCNELFAINKSTIHLVLQECVCAINMIFKNQMRWPKIEELVEVMVGFKTFGGLPFIHGAIDVIHIHESKGTFVKDYFSFKSKFYNMQLQIVDCQNKFTYVFVGIPSSMNDICILQNSSLY